MRVIVFTSHQSPVLAPLLETDMSIVGVVIYGDQEGGRSSRLGRAIQFMYQLINRQPACAISKAEQRQIPVFHATSMDDSELDTWLTTLQHDVLLVYRVPIIPSHLYKHSRYAINLHPSLLPAYRGGHPLLWAIWDGCEQTGCTVHLLEESADTGGIITQKSFAIPNGVSEGELEYFAETEIGVPLLYDAVKCLSSDAAIAPQPEDSPTLYARRRKPEQIWQDIPFETWTANRLWRVLRFTGIAPFQSMLEQNAMYEWSIGELENTAGSGAPGSMQSDHRGFYISHSSGKIRLQHSFRIKRAIKWLLRV